VTTMQVYERARAILESLNSLAYGSWQALKREDKTVFVNSETNEGFETCPGQSTLWGKLKTCWIFFSTVHKPQNQS
jgi:hypothetical protein